MKREDIIEQLEVIKALIEWGYSLDYQIVLDQAIKELEKPEENYPKGEWIPMEVGYYSITKRWRCSICGRIIRGARVNFPFCHCGADMRQDDICFLSDQRALIESDVRYEVPKCPKCGSENVDIIVNMGVQMPIEFYRRLDGNSLPYTAFRVMHPDWDHADYICKECHTLIRHEAKDNPEMIEVDYVINFIKNHRYIKQSAKDKIIKNLILNYKNRMEGSINDTDDR